MEHSGIHEALGAFSIDGVADSRMTCDSGHINDTLVVRYNMSDGSAKRYTVQRINTAVFTRPDEAMDNIAGVTAFLRGKIAAAGDDPDRETLTIIPTRDGQRIFRDSVIGGCWRCYGFIENASGYDLAPSPEVFYQSAVAFGRFQRMLCDYDASLLHETIAGFHDTLARFEKLKAAVKADVCGRAAGGTARDRVLS